MKVLTGLKGGKANSEVHFEEQFYHDFNYQLPAVKSLIDNLNTFKIIKKRIPSDQMENLLQVLL